MKQTLYFSFSIILLTLVCPAVGAVSFPQQEGAVPEQPSVLQAEGQSAEERARQTDGLGSSVVLKVSVTDVYVWSGDREMYRLLSNQFDFKGLAGQDSQPVTNSVTTKATKESTRYMSVFVDRVQFVDVAGKTVVVQAQLADNREELAVYFSEERKKDILKTLLEKTGVLRAFLEKTGVNFPVESQQTSSHYECSIQNKRLVCVLNYALKMAEERATSSSSPAPSVEL